MSRFHFEPSDVVRVRLAADPAPLVEVWMALASAQKDGDERLFAERRRRLRTRLNRVVPTLGVLVDPSGAMPDFLAPVSDCLDEGLDAIVSTPGDIAHDQLLERYSDFRDAPRWVRALADGDRTSWTTLVRMIRVAHERLRDAPTSRNDAGFYEDLAARSAVMIDQGVAAVLDSIPYSRWDGRVLQNDDGCTLPGSDLPIGGGGVTLLPCATWSGSPLLATPRDSGPLIIYAAVPVGRSPSRAADRDALAALLGPTRAAVLRLLARPLTTSAIAGALNISLASASEHAKILRAAGLVTTTHKGQTVQHSRTGLGNRLVG